MAIGKIGVIAHYAAVCDKCGRSQQFSAPYDDQRSYYDPVLPLPFAWMIIQSRYDAETQQWTKQMDLCPICSIKYK